MWCCYMDHYLPSLIFLYTKKRTNNKKSKSNLHKKRKTVEHCHSCQMSNTKLHLMTIYIYTRSLPQRTRHVSRLRSRRNRWKGQIIGLFIGTRFPCFNDFLIRFIRDFPKIDTGFASCRVLRDIVSSVACPMLSNDVNFFSGTMSCKNLCLGWNARTKRVVEPRLKGLITLCVFFTRVSSVLFFTWHRFCFLSFFACHPEYPCCRFSN